MLVAQTKLPAPAWVPVMGAEVLFEPIDRPMMRRARRSALEALGQNDDGRERSAGEQLEELGDALSEALILAGARDWRGVVQVVVDDEGAPLLDERGQQQVTELPFSPEALVASLADPITFDAFDAAYVRPFAARERERAAPGKDSPPSPDGTGTKETLATTIAGSPAEAKAADVASVPTGSTPRKRTKKKTSGAS